ncbi:MAG: orotate phosphoribosyltransferase [Oscillospiraceae bacterium]|nr:orotate phosphoribosyltransferase [Oscillospiraceae bacterium]
MSYKNEFISFMAECEVLTFGDFTLKSGRKAPYFINAGKYRTGAQLRRLGEFYADCIAENGIEGDNLFGPAYKGIPLACSAAIALSEKYNRDAGFCFDRKEVKDHGEGGVFVGKQPVDGEKVIIIEDVITSGKAFSEVYPKLKAAANVDITGMVITVDRMEKALDSQTGALQQIYQDYGVRVYPIVTINDIIDAIESGVIDGKEYLGKMREYRAEYGIN